MSAGWRGLLTPRSWDIIIRKAGLAAILSSRIKASVIFPQWRTAAAFGGPFLVYLLTVAPTIYNLDSAELTTAAATGGIVRATGYPLYLLAGYTWSWLPIGDVGYRLNLFSAFNGALTVALAERILRRWTVSPSAAFGALGLLTVAPFFWGLSLIAEVYTLHTAFMAGIILLLLRWADDPTPHRLALVGLTVGLSLAHHAATVLLIPGCVWYVLIVAPRRALAPGSIFLGLAAVLAGLSVYLYLPLRYQFMPAFNYAGRYDATGAFIPVNLLTPAGLWWLISGRAFAGEMLAYRGLDLWGEVWRFVGQLWRAFFALGVGPGLLGMIILWRRDWRLGGMLLLMFGCSAGFYIDYRVIDKDTMFLPTYLLWTLWLGFGYQWLIDWIRPASKEGERLAQRKVWILRAVMIGAVFLAMAWNWSLVDLSRDWSTRTQSEEIYSLVQDNALIFGWWDTAPPLQYLQLVEGQRPDVQVINRFLITPDDMRRLILREVTHRPVYVDSVPLELLLAVSAEPVGPIYRLLPRHRPLR